ncbi:E4 [Gammapapillomavirus 12]|uniref:E4 n=2 Tax=Papillomaviridae TaxID=151340 RepID=A0A2D2ALP7_9PAPI|nr:E4 [Gammapapillomavirus 12]QAB13907.1 MAG: E2 protein [Human papillomavirus]
MKLFLPLFPVLRVLQPSLKLEPPRTPFPSRKHLESANKPTPTPTVTRPPARQDFDYDDEDPGKENLPPEQPPSEDEEDWSVVRHLLKRWALDLDRYRDKVLRDLEDCKRRLGIHS